MGVVTLGSVLARRVLARSHDQQRAERDVSQCDGGGPGERQGDGEDQQALGEGEQRHSEQRVLQPDHKHIVQQINREGVVRETVEDGERRTPNLRQAASMKKQPPAQASAKLASTRICKAMDAVGVSFIVRAVRPIHNKNDASAPASHDSQLRANDPSGVSSPLSSPKAPRPRPAK